jgi:2-polyprenyl-3-methyl-5-hydroxy-6-metoxy-1,4-benzoquinol methylase|tara:strand:- start:26 stop:622 length:597 start_codon:yes stop_codon:yes gene_type:complete
MHKHIDSWKNSSGAFEQQLARNMQELNGQFPPHWVHFIDCLKKQTVARVVDIGCGAGVYYHISTQMDTEYIGYDYSQHAVDLAIKTWNGNFICKNYQEITPHDIEEGDLVIGNALCDVLPNGDECLRHLLQLESNNLLIQRIKTTQEPSFFTEYNAYGIMTYEFYHNFEQLTQDIKDYGYIATYHKLYDDVFDLELNR